MRYFIYARKSTDDEDRQVLSIEAQLKELREYAQRENLSVCKEVVEAKTAKKPGRPLFNDMILSIERGLADGILAWHPDRLARNSVDGGRIIYLVDQKVIKDLRFPTLRFDNNAQGKFMLSIVFGQSKYYIDALSENIRRGIRLKLSKGIWPQWAPIGYLNDRKTRTIIIDEGKAPFIKRVFELYSSGEHTLEEIRNKINSIGLVGRKDKPLSRSQYQTMLKNPIYYGVFRYKGETYEGTHEPIITKKLFDRCQEVMRLRGKHKEPQMKRFVLRGLMKCGECGRSITAELQKGHIYYRCTKRLTNCKQKYVREEELAAQIKSFIQKVSLSDDWTKRILEELERDRNSSLLSSQSQQQNLEVKIKEIDAKISKLIDVYLEGALTLEEYQAKKEAYINEKKKLQESMRDFAAGSNSWFEPARDFVTLLNRVEYAVKEGNLESQKEFLEKIGSNFILKERRLNFPTEGIFRLFFKDAPYPNWRCSCDEIRMFYRQNPLLNF
jgi:DNA invertase Pin-like site-specific DNA recombinase